jgi:hypothetical protein
MASNKVSTKPVLVRVIVAGIPLSFAGLDFIVAPIRRRSSF